jgi:hypothetical protein
MAEAVLENKEALALSATGLGASYLFWDGAKALSRHNSSYDEKYSELLDQEPSKLEIRSDYHELQNEISSRKDNRSFPAKRGIASIQGKLAALEDYADREGYRISL